MSSRANVRIQISPSNHFCGWKYCWNTRVKRLTSTRHIDVERSRAHCLNTNYRNETHRAHFQFVSFVLQLFAVFAFCFCCFRLIVILWLLKCSESWPCAHSSMSVSLIRQNCLKQNDYNHRNHDVVGAEIIIYYFVSVSRPPRPSSLLPPGWMDFIVSLLLAYLLLRILWKWTNHVFCFYFIIVSSPRMLSERVCVSVFRLLSFLTIVRFPLDHYSAQHKTYWASFNRNLLLMRKFTIFRFIFYVKMRFFPNQIWQSLNIKIRVKCERINQNLSICISFQIDFAIRLRARWTEIEIENRMTAFT